MSTPAPDEADIPLLTEVVEDKAAPIDPAALEALARQLEQALLERLTPEITRATAQAVREALAATLHSPAGEPKKD